MFYDIYTRRQILKVAASGRCSRRSFSTRSEYSDSSSFDITLKCFRDPGTWAGCCNTFYGHNLQMFVTS